MQYGYFDPVAREYVIDRVDTPVSWINYIGLKDMYGVFNQTAEGCLLYRSPEYHRITRFRADAVPMDRPDHYVYISDNETKDCWSISWQPAAICQHDTVAILVQFTVEGCFQSTFAESRQQTFLYMQLYSYMSPLFTSVF